MRKPVAAVLAASLLLACMPPGGAEAAPAAAVQLAVTQSTVNLREEPSTKGKVMRLLAKGESLSVLERVDGSWFKVKERAGKIGFVSSSTAYISLVEPPAASAKPALAANAEILATVTLRKSASVSSDRIRYLKIGELVQIVAVPTAYWYQVKDEQGYSGYISSDKKYVSVTGSLPGAPAATLAPTPSKTPAATLAPTPSKAPAASATPTPSKAPAATATPTPSKTPVATATPTPSKTPAATATPTPSKTPAASATPTPSKTPAATATPAPSKAPAATATPSPSKTPAATATPTPSQAPAATATPTPESGGTDAFAPNAKAASVVAFRVGPSTAQERIRYLKTNEAVQIVSAANRSWYQIVDAAGQSGYVSSDAKYITVTGTLPSEPSATPAPVATASPTPAPSGDEDGLASPELEAVIAAGLKYLGTPYEFGSSRSDTTTFDCSDFVRQAFLDALGVKLAADSRGQGQHVKNKGAYTQEWNELKRGDLMFFTTTAISKEMSAEESLDASLISHVGIYLGDNKILQTYSKESGGVQVTDIPQNSTWKTRFMFGGSAL
ncbi:SH3 domain-containing protein [Paenibacillus albicereus]|uniref:SH3 domain-containing protein n=1 Tax=Paenibacillus albicereus TaxID=2726185 RepID=A0A6H2GUK5_9BACL|nr:SH3 domain-containing protein [Paenibacillus albicereus]QJC51113.1 SH3 domain-containing protein [Paenibacillus albicereus]